MVNNLGSYKHYVQRAIHQILLFKTLQAKAREEKRFLSSFSSNILDLSVYYGFSLNINKTICIFPDAKEANVQFIKKN